VNFSLPADLPAPSDDGAADHLVGKPWPNLSLAGTDGNQWDLTGLEGRCVVFAYPMTGRPDTALPDGWDDIPGARGCTPETCGFRDLFQEFATLEIHLFGLSTQTLAYQSEMTERLKVPFPVLSDPYAALGDLLDLPTLEVDVPGSPVGPESRTLYRRLTMVVDNGFITHRFYPVFPPDAHADDVLRWARSG
jgi:peroxiredoxin